jgi:hypothetical protein
MLLETFTFFWAQRQHLNGFSALGKTEQESSKVAC